MNKHRIAEIISSPRNLNYGSDLPLVKELIESFPYFSTPYMMLTKMLHEENSIYFDKNLKISAAYIGNREILYDYIHEKANEQAPHIFENKKDLTVEPLVNDNDRIEALEIPEISIVQNENPIPALVLNAENETGNKETILPDNSDSEQKTSLNPEIAENLSKPEQPYIFDDNVPETAGKRHSDNSDSELQTSLNPEIVENIPEPEPSYVLDKNVPETTGKRHSDNSDSELKTSLNPEISENTSEPESSYVLDKNVPETTDKRHSDNSDSELKTSLNQEIVENIPQPEQSRVLDNNVPETAGKRHFMDFGSDQLQYPITDYFGQYYKKESRILETKKSVTDDQLSDRKSFSDWLDVIESNRKTTVAKKEIKFQKPQNENKSDFNHLIDKFIHTEPKIRQQQSRMYKPEDMAKLSVKEDRHIATETLAEIYLKQGLKTKAIEIFQQLILKYPEKSDYFAARIKEIQSEGSF